MPVKRKLYAPIILCLFMFLLVNACDESALDRVLDKVVSAVYTQEAASLAAVQTAYTYNVVLTWQNPADTLFANVVIKRKAFNPAASYDDTEAVAVYTGADETCTDTGLAGNTVYYYTLYAINSAQKRSQGITAGIAVLPPDLLYHQEPGSFAGVQVAGTTDVALSWTNPAAADFAGVTLLRKTGNYASGITDSSAVTVYTGTGGSVTDPGLVDSTIYFYTLYTRDTGTKVSTGTRRSIEIVPVPVPAVVYAEEVTNFNAVMGTGSIAFSWINPTDVNFDSVLLKRKASGYPTAYNDAGAIDIYSGSAVSCSDATVVAGNTYYYAIFCRNTGGNYSIHPPKTYKNVVSFDSTIRLRSFYLAGGSTDYASPFDNLVSAIDAFDPVTSTIYANITSLPTPRYACAVASAYGKLYVFGGIDVNKNVAATVDVLDLASPTWPANAWSTIANMPLPRYSLRAENVNNRLFVFGGSSAYFGANASPVYLNTTLFTMKSTNHVYDPATGAWIVDELVIPALVNRTMNMASGSLGGNLFYVGGRINAAAAVVTNGYIHNMTSNASTLIALGTFVAAGEMGGVAYTKKSATNQDVNLFMIIGGTTTGGAPYEPLRVVTTGANLTALNTCYFTQFPNPLLAAPTFAAVGTVPKTLLTARAYTEAEYYGNYIYVFGGVNNSGVVLNTIERIEVDDACTFPNGWTSIGSAGFAARFGFDITKINN